jgi:hypothetical protein
VGGVIGGLALILLLTALFLYRWRQQNKTPAVDAVPRSFGVEDNQKSTSSPSTRFLSSMNREQAATVHHTTPDAFVQSQEGLQQLPGRTSPSRAAPTLVETKREQELAMPHSGDNHAAADSVPSTEAGVKLAPWTRAPSPPTPTVTDPVLLELQSLREEMTRMRQLVDERGPSEAPPSYDHHGD